MNWRDNIIVVGGDALDILAELPDHCVDAVVCDPPYGLSDVKPDALAEVIQRWAAGERDIVPDGKGFMGKDWDKFVPPPALWDECHRVLKPGGHLLSFAGTRTVDVMGLSIRFAGFEIRDSIAWLMGSGFPKSLDVSKAIDKAAGAQREVVGTKLGRPGYSLAENTNEDRAVYGKFTDAESECAITAPATDAAKKWEGWGTALKPAMEPIVVARKPFKGTVAANVLEHGTGALNIDACRVDSEPRRIENYASTGPQGCMSHGHGGGEGHAGRERTVRIETAGRWPTNVVLDEAAAAELDEQSGIQKSGVAVQRHGGGQKIFGGIAEGQNTLGARADMGYGDTGGASRFFPVFKYQAKAPKRERPVYVKEPTLRLRSDLTPEQVDHVVARLREAGVEID